jgi:diguanylate cyclase (GGDEF)-like protein
MAKREQSGFVVCYIDIDNLKIINDTYGHAEGDRLIQTVVDSLKMVIRGSDYICRMGGDEFLLIFPKAKLKDSDNLIERIRNELNHQTICDLSIDFSFGLSEFHAGDSLSADELINMADSRMFKAKKTKKS